MAGEHSDTIRCPSCGAENVRGADVCASCDTALAGNDLPTSDELNTSVAEAIRVVGRPATVSPATPVRDAVALLARQPSGAVVVMEGARIAGIFTERDVLRKVAGYGEMLDEPVSALMTPDPVILRENDAMAAALHKMGTGGFRHIPLVREGELVAVVTAHDLLLWIMGRYFGE